MILSISSMSATMPSRSASSRRADLDAEAQPRQRRAQIVRHAGEQQRAILLGLAQVREHLLKPRFRLTISEGPISGSGGGELALARRCATAALSSRSGRAR